MADGFGVFPGPEADAITEHIHILEKGAVMVVGTRATDADFQPAGLVMLT